MKRFFSLFLVVVLLLTVVPTFYVSAAKQPTFVISNNKGNVGDTVEITISTKNNPGIISMQVLVAYDGNALKLKKATEGKFSGVSYSAITRNPFIATWIKPLDPNNDTNGVFVTLEFEILDTAPNGKSEISLSYDPENVFEFNTSAKDNFKNVHFEVENGYVDITNPNPPKQPTDSSQTSEPVQNGVSSGEGNSGNQAAQSTQTQSSTESGKQEQDNTYEQMIEGLLNPSQNAQTESADKNSSTSVDSNAIITDGAIISEDNSDSADVDNADESNSKNDWLIWVVVAAIVVLGSAFTVVIIKSKKQ